MTRFDKQGTEPLGAQFHFAAKAGAPASRRPFVAAAAAIVILGTIAWHNALSNGVTNFDDHWQVIHNPLVRAADFEAVAKTFSTSHHGEYLPVKILSYTADRALYTSLGVDFVFGVHLSNVLLHLANSVLVALICALVIRDLSSREDLRRAALPVGAFAGVLFVLHPVHVEAVAWLSSRKDVLSFFFLALAFLAFRSALLRRRFLAGFACLLFFALALGSKTTAVCLPLLATAYWLLLSREGGGRAVVLLAALYVTGATAVIAAAAAAAGSGYAGGPVGGSYFTHYLTVVRTFPFYMRLLLFPVNQAVVYALPSATGLADAGVWWGAIMLAAQIAVAVFARARVARFIVLWYILALVPVLNLVPAAVPALAADRYAYTASLPFALAPAVIAWNIRSALLSRRATAVAGALVAACVVYAGALGVATWSRNRVWYSSKTLWTDCIAKNPSDRMALVNLGSVYFEEKDYDRARLLFERAVDADRFFILAHYRLGETYEQMDRPYIAKIFYSRTLNQPSSLTDHYTREYRALAGVRLSGMAYGAGKYSTAVRLARTAVEILVSPATADVILDAPSKGTGRRAHSTESSRALPAARRAYWRALSTGLEMRRLADSLMAMGDAATGDPQQAERLYLRAIEVAREYPKPRVALARLYLRFDQCRGAYDQFEAASLLGATGADFYSDWGLAAVGEGSYEQAERLFGKALVLDPSLEDVKVKLAFALAHQGKRGEALVILDAVLAGDPENADAQRVRDLLSGSSVPSQGAETDGR
ncbi:MAG: tetratricopeptide repeat protein [Planctomycetota bacterium]